MPHYVLDARVATPHFPGIGRYVSNLAAALIPLLAGDERLTILYDPAHPLSFLDSEQTSHAAPAAPGGMKTGGRMPSAPASQALSEQVQAIPVSASPFSLRQQWQLPRLLRQIPGFRFQVPGSRFQPPASSFQLTAPSFQLPASSRQLPAASFQLPASSPQPPAASLYHSPYYLMPYRPGVPTVLTVYDLIPLLFPEHSTPRARLLFRWTTALALRAAKVVIAISEATRADFLARFRLAAERIVAIPLAADPIFRPQPADAIAAVRARYQLPERYVLYLGSNKPHKNLLRLIEAWHLAVTSFQLPASSFQSPASSIQLPASSLVIAGAWDARYPESKARAAALGLGDRVRFLGPVAGADLPALYAGAALFVFPSLYEGFGLPVLEAMACGVPVVCSNVASLREVTSPPGPLSYEERGRSFPPPWQGGGPGGVGEGPTSPPGPLSYEERGRSFPPPWQGGGPGGVGEGPTSLPARTSPPNPLSCEERGSEEASAALLVDPLDVVALAEAIRRVLDDPTLADDLRARGLAQAARFSWERTAQETLAVYRRVLQTRG